MTTTFDHPRASPSLRSASNASPQPLRINSSTSGNTDGRSTPTHGTSKLDLLMDSLSEFSVRSPTSPSAVGRAATPSGMRGRSVLPQDDSLVGLRRASQASSIGSLVADAPPAAAAAPGRKRAKSVSRNAFDGVSEEALAQITLGQIQASQSTLSAHLQKLNSSSTPQPAHQPIESSNGWKLRFFVLSESLNLYIFKPNATQKSIPITFLPISLCNIIYESSENAWSLRIQGDGMSTEGKIVKRVWVLRFPDETTVNMWAKHITRLLESQRHDRLMPEQQHHHEHHHQPIEPIKHASVTRSVASRESNGQQNPASASRSSFERKQSQQQQNDEYIHRQKMAQEKYRQEQILRWALEDKERAERERGRIEWERRQKLSKDVEFAMIDKGLQEKRKKSEEKAKEKADVMKAMMGL